MGIQEGPGWAVLAWGLLSGCSETVTEVQTFRMLKTSLRTELSWLLVCESSRPLGTLPPTYLKVKTILRVFSF